MANPQTEKGHMRIANDIWVAIIKRKFTLRQRNILDFILRMSWGCRKKSAVIPMLKDFELCGVRKEHIRIELEHLVAMNVLMWDSNRNEYWFNKDFDQWKVTPVKGWSEERFNELISMNLGNKVTETVTGLPNQQPNQNSNSVTKKETQLLQKKSYSVTKKATGK
ncbi:phage replication protein [Brevibacillus sp. VP]|uniref:replication protein n=1 Tax=Brevibacillus sp. VP TaxID=2293326 RepID=UPI000E2F71ED|nr:replication protein [Brevibacillus sp. VP]RFB35697.1 phage replication protein [Brevibacillus sp. VP]